MPRSGSTAVALALAALAGACASSGEPALPPPGSLSEGKAPPGPAETSFTVPGTPAGVYAQVARSALNCWFGSDGPLKATHIFHAAAEPPATGGAAEIVIRERDAALRDQRGTRAYRVSFETAPAGVRVGAAALKLEPAVAQAMAKDVEVWAKGGSGCQLRIVMPPPPPPAAKVKGKAKSKKR
jgi:hypothetical protein